MPKGSVHEEDETVVNIFAPNMGAPQYRRQIQCVFYTQAPLGLDKPMSGAQGPPGMGASTLDGSDLDASTSSARKSADESWVSNIRIQGISNSLCIFIT